MSSPSSTVDTEIDASVTFAEALMEQINREDVKNMVTAQRDMLCRFEKTNEMLINFNILSANRFAVANNELKAHTQLMYEMKRDLDSIFKRIRVLKDRLNKSYPDAFKACNVAPLLEDEEEEEELRVSTTSPIMEPQSTQISTDTVDKSTDNQSETLDKPMDNQSETLDKPTDNQSETLDKQTDNQSESLDKQTLKQSISLGEKTDNQSGSMSQQADSTSVNVDHSVNTPEPVDQTKNENQELL